MLKPMLLDGLRDPEEKISENKDGQNSHVTIDFSETCYDRDEVDAEEEIEARL